MGFKIRGSGAVLVVFISFGRIVDQGQIAMFCINCCVCVFVISKNRRNLTVFVISLINVTDNCWNFFFLYFDLRLICS